MGEGEGNMYDMTPKLISREDKAVGEILVAQTELAKAAFELKELGESDEAIIASIRTALGIYRKNN